MEWLGCIVYGAFIELYFFSQNWKLPLDNSPESFLVTAANQRSFPESAFSLSLRNKQRISDGSLEIVAGGWRVQADNWPLLHQPTTIRMMTPRIERDIVQSPGLKWMLWLCALQIVHEIDQMGMKESRMTNFRCIPFDKLLNFLLIVWELRWKIKCWVGFQLILTVGVWFASGSPAAGLISVTQCEVLRNFVTRLRC